MAVTSISTLQPTNTHTDLLLSELALEFSYPNLVGEFFAPAVTVSKQSDRYNIYYADDINRLVNDARGPGGEINQVEWGLSEDSYYTDCHALANSVPWETLANADSAYQRYLSTSFAAQSLKHMVMLNHEAKVKTIMTTTGNYASGFTADLDSGTANFDDSGVNGLKTIQQYVRKIRLVAPGSRIVAGISGDAWIEIQNDANFKPTLTDNLLAQSQQMRTALGIDEIRIIDVETNTADKGQTPTRTAYWPSNCMWIVAQGTGVQPTAMRTFVWSNPDLGTSSGEAVRVLDDERDMIRTVQYLKYYDVKPVGVNRDNDFQTAVYLRNLYSTL